jgi:dTDP-4-dehydrorhamnose 3,5-epimerase
VSRFTVSDTPLQGLKIVRRSKVEDRRGSFQRMFCADELAAAGWQGPIRQINLARTVRRGAVRGMHYQLPPMAEIKLVSCIEGDVWDVAVDLRRGSPTFLNWHAEHLGSENATSLLIPEGFAHGFQVLSEGATLLYAHSRDWSPQMERGIRPSDPRLDISWPLSVTDQSDRDANRDLILDSFSGVEL